MFYFVRLIFALMLFIKSVFLVSMAMSMDFVVMLLMLVLIVMVDSVFSEAVYPCFDLVCVAFSRFFTPLPPSFFSFFFG